MKSETDEEILALKHKLEAKGFTYKSTDQEWIEHYRYLNAPIKEILKRNWAKLKTWILIHPLTTAMLGLVTFAGVGLLLLMTSILKDGVQLMNGQVPNPITFDQLTGFTLIIAAGFFTLCITIGGWFFIHVSGSLITDDEQRYKRKLRRKELAILCEDKKQGEK